MGLKNIVIVNDYNYIQGGASKVSIITANVLYDMGYNVYFFCGVQDKEKNDLNPKIPVYSVDETDCLNSKNKIKGLARGVFNSRAKKILKGLLKTLDNKETIVHIHGWTKDLSSSFINICKSKKFKTVLTIHDYFLVCPNGGFYNFKKNCICHLKPLGIKCVFENCDSRNRLFKAYRVFRLFVQKKLVRFQKKIDAFVTISDFNENILRKYLGKKKIIRVYNPTLIDNNNVSRAKAENNDYYVFIGRISKEKGIDILCEEANKLNIKLKVLGDGPLLNELKTKYDANKNIDFLGWQSSSETLQYLRKSRALIFPSIWYEGAPLTIFEALSQGIPCIVSNLSAAIDFVSEKNGVVFDFNQENWLENSIKYIENDIKNLSVNSFEMYWKDPYDIDRYKNEIVKAYLSVLFEEEE